MRTTAYALQAAPAPRAPRPDSRVARQALDERVRLALRRESLTLPQLAGAVGAAEEAARASLDRAVTAGVAVNVGIPEYPVWTWRIGPDATRPEVAWAVKRLVSDRPSSVEDLVAATGADRRDVTRALSALRRSSDGRLVDMGCGGVSRWLLT